MEQYADDDYYLLHMKDVLDSYPLYSPPQHPTKLSDHIYIGNQDNADDVDLLSALEITHVLNVAGTRTFDLTRSPYPAKSGIVGFLMIPAQDYNEFDIMQYFPEAITFLEKARDAGGRAFVHCSIGVNRSGAVAAAYLMVSQKKTLLDVTVDLKAKRLCILCNTGFRKQLVRFARVRHLLDQVEQSRSKQPRESATASNSSSATNGVLEQKIVPPDYRDEKNEMDSGSGVTNGNFEPVGSKPIKDETFDLQLQKQEAGSNNRISTDENGSNDIKNQNGWEENQTNFTDKTETNRKSENHDDATYGSSTIEVKFPTSTESESSTEMWNDISNYKDNFEAKKAEIWKMLGNIKCTALNLESPILDSITSLEEHAPSSKAYTRSYTNYQFNKYEPDAVNESNNVDYLSALALEHPELKRSRPIVGITLNRKYGMHLTNGNSIRESWKSPTHIKYSSTLDEADSDDNISDFSQVRNAKLEINRPSNHISNLSSSTSKPQSYHTKSTSEEISNTYHNLPYNGKINQTSHTYATNGETSSSKYSSSPNYERNNEISRRYFTADRNSSTQHSHPYPTTQHDSNTEYFPKIEIIKAPIPTYSYGTISNEINRRSEFEDDDDLLGHRTSSATYFTPVSNTYLDSKLPVSNITNYSSSYSALLEPASSIRPYSKSPERFVSNIKPLSFYRMQVNSTLGLKNRIKVDDDEEFCDNDDENILRMKRATQKHSGYGGIDLSVKPYTSGRSSNGFSSIRRYSIPAKLSTDVVLCQPRSYVDKTYKLENFQANGVSAYKATANSYSASQNSKRPYSANGYNVHQKSSYNDDPVKYSEFLDVASFDSYPTRANRSKVTPLPRNKSFYL